MNYAFAHNDKGFTPNGLTIPADQVAEHNKQLEAKEIEWLKTAPDKVTLYVSLPKDLSHRPTCGSDSAYAQPNFASVTPGDTKAGLSIHTWLGTSVATWIVVGHRRRIGFGYHSYRRSVSCKIFGVQYHGWYMESSGDYCRLRKAKVTK